MICLLYLFSHAQSGPITIHGEIDKPFTKFALYELFYDVIDHNDVNASEAILTDQFLIVNKQNVQRDDYGRLALDGTSIFNTDINELPFLSSVQTIQPGILWPSELSFTYDNFGNITTSAESDEVISNNEYSNAGGGCIEFVINDENNQFDQNYLTVFNQVRAYLSSIFCCSSTNTVTFQINPIASGVASATPEYNGSHVDLQGGCNGITENPFLTGLEGQPQNVIANMNINTNINWFYGDGSIDADEIDLFSVMLHEFLHGIAVGSRITQDGSPLDGAYSPWDMFLEINGVPLLERVDAPDGADCCYVFEINDDLTLPDDLITASQNGNITVAGIPVCNSDLSVNSQGEFLNMLSHIDEDCTLTDCDDQSTYSEYVLNSSICPGEIRNTISPDEIQLLENLGYCTDNPSPAPTCYVSLVDDEAIALENGDPIMISVFDNDVLPTNFSADLVVFDLTCSDASGISVSLTNNGFQVQGNVPGNYCFCYTVDSCDEFCDQAKVCVTVFPSDLLESCIPEVCDLLCFGDFEGFVSGSTGGVSEYLNSLQLSQYDFNGLINSPDILQFQGNQFIYIANIGPNTNFPVDESFTLPLSEPIAPGCSVRVSFDAECTSANGILFYGSDQYINCPFPAPLNAGAGGQDICNDGNTISLLNVENISCSIGDVNSPSQFNPYSFEVPNNTGVNINFITVKLPQGGDTETQRAVFDNIIITSSCETEIEITDITPEEDLLICVGETVEIIYEVCLTGDGGSTDVTLIPNLSNAILGSVSINPMSPFANGPVTINDLEAGECEIIVLTVDVALDLSLGQQIEIVMSIDNFDACNQQDGAVTTFLTIDGILPSAEFSAIIEECPTVMFNSFEPNNEETSYAWDFGDGNSSTEPNPTHTYATAGTYTVTLEVTNECGIASSMQEINFDCEDGPDPNPLSCDCPTEQSVILSDPNITNYSLQQLVTDGILPQTVFSGCIIVSGTLTIDMDYQFQGATFIMDSEASINVIANNTLNVFVSMLSGCGALWTGVHVDQGATLNFLFNVIKDAVYAIELENLSTFSCQGNTFDKNYVGLFIDSNPTGELNRISYPMPFIQNTFECTSALEPYEGNTVDLVFTDITYSGILINDASIFLGIPRAFATPFNNEFRNIYNGIRSFNSDIISAGSSFVNMISENFDDYDSESGHGIYAISSSIFQSGNVYDTMKFGVRGNQSSIFSAVNSYTTIKVGIEMVNTPPSGRVNVGFERFTNYSERGILVSNAVNDVTLVISENEFFNTEILDNSTLQEAITISNCNGIVISSNTIDIAEDQAGISMTNCNDGEVRFNDVNFFDEPTYNSGWFRGIQTNNSNGNLIQENTVNGANLQVVGFDTNNSIAQTFECNSTENTTVGMQYAGQCNDSELLTNGIGRSLDAGLSLFNAIIGGQDHTGNLWCQNSTAVYNGPINLVQASSFIVDPADGSAGCETSPPANINNWFDELPGTTPICGNLVERGESITETSDLMAARQTYDDEYADTWNWNAGINLLAKIAQDESILTMDDEILDFYNDSQDTEMSAYLDMRNALQELFVLDNTDSNEFSQLNYQLESLSSQISALNRDIVQAQSEVEAESFITQKGQLESQYYDTVESYQQKVETVKVERIVEARALKNQNKSLSIPNLAARNERLMNVTRLNAVIIDDFLSRSNIQQRIQNIANQCVWEGGMAVYDARILWDYIQPGLQNDYHDVDNCYANITERAQDEITESVPARLDLVIYPNPSSGVVNLELNSDLNEGNIEVKDVLGRVVYTQRLGTKQRDIQLDLSKLKGVYFILMLDGDRLVSTDKIVIN